MLHKYSRVAISYTDALPITIETSENGLLALVDELVAAALRAAADRVECDMPDDNAYAAGFYAALCDVDAIAAAEAAAATADAAWAAARAASAAARQRQRDLLLRLIAEAPVSHEARP